MRRLRFGARFVETCTMARSHASRSPQRRRRVGKARTPDQLPVLQPAAAGIDIGAEELYVALPPDRTPEPVRVFGVYTAQLVALVAWLREHRITTVAMESTGVYWIPVFQALEAAGLEVCLVNPRHTKNVRGRKTDVADCQWLQLLHSVGLLAASFRPPDAVCALRSILRHRADLVAQASRHIQHMQKSCTQMNLHLHLVLSDLSGQSGLRILDALLGGERDPQRLAALRDRRCQTPEEEIVQALQGDWRSEHLFVLRQARESYAYCQSQLRECDAEIQRHLTGFTDRADPAAAPPAPKNAPKHTRKNQIELPETDLRTELFRLYGTDITQTPGLGPSTVAALYAELGRDLKEAFQTGKRFCSWQGVCPDPQKTGGRVFRHRTRDVQHRVATLFRVAAQSLHRSDNALGRFYRRIRAKLGAPQAVTATAHKLARIFFELVTTGAAYDETIFARREAEQEAQLLKRLGKQAERFGYTLTPNPVVS
jgi:transposase